MNDMKDEIEEAFSLLREHVCAILPNISSDQIVPENSLHTLGANSIDRADIIANTLESLNLHAPLVIFARAKNIGELVNLMVEQQKLQMTKCSQ